jgi:hypothetical protein
LRGGITRIGPNVHFSNLLQSWCFLQRITRRPHYSNSENGQANETSITTGHDIFQTPTAILVGGLKSTAGRGRVQCVRVTAHAWLNSEAYQTILPGRTENTDGRLVIVDGVPD